MSTLLFVWKATGWRTEQGAKLTDFDLFQKLHSVVEDITASWNITITFRNIKREDNKLTDALARLGSGQAGSVPLGAGLGGTMEIYFVGTVQEAEEEQAQLSSTARSEGINGGDSVCNMDIQYTVFAARQQQSVIAK